MKPFPTSTAGPLTRTDFVRYAGAGGDFNPMHHDEPAARAAGHASVFGMGLLHAGILGIRLARWAAPATVRRYQVRFTGRVWPGDVLTFTGRVVEETAQETALELSVTRDTGELVLRAWATVA